MVIDKENRKTDLCALRKPGGQVISPELSEGDGCRELERGDSVRVRYDPEGVAGPVTSVESGSYGGVMGALAVVFVGMGTWGCVRMSRWDAAGTGSRGRAGQ